MCDVLENIIDQLALTSVEDEVEVSFAGRGLKLDSEEDAKEIVQAIKNTQGMTTLRLEGNTIGIMAAKAIAKALESQPKFKKALWKDMFTQRTEHEIPDALNYLSSGITLAGARLVELDLSDNAFGYRGLKGIVNLLKSAPCYTLSELRFNNNGLGITGAKMLATALSQCLINSTNEGKPLQLKLFVCGRNRLENEGTLALSVFLKAVGTLEYVALPQNGIYYEGIIGLSDALASNPSLKFLNLEDNSLTEKGARAFAKYLPVLNNLETINFGDCLLQTAGAKAIAKVLTENCPKLRELFLGYNEIKKDGGLAVIESLKNKQLLEKIVLNGNQFGEGCELIESTAAAFGMALKLESLGEDDDGSEIDEENEDGSACSEAEEQESNDGSPMKKIIAVEDFIYNPTSSNLALLREAQTDLLAVLSASPSLSDYFDLFLIIASVVKLDDEKTEKAACYYTDTILDKAFAMFAEDMLNFNNEILVVLGLIKGEDHVKKSDLDLNGVFIVLKHAVKQKYFHKSTHDLVKFFVSKPLKFNLNPKIKHGLLQALYQT